MSLMSAYHAFHVAVLSSFLLRPAALEQQLHIYAIPCILAFRKLGSCPDVHTRLDVLYYYAKLWVLLSCGVSRDKAGLVYALLFALALLLPRPTFGSGHAVIAGLTPASYDAYVASHRTLVYIYAAWHTPSLQLSNAFAACSVSHPSIDYAKLDVSQAPALAARLGIDLGLKSASLPTLLLVDHGKETRRLPSATQPLDPLLLGSENLAAYFAL